MSICRLVLVAFLTVCTAAPLSAQIVTSEAVDKGFQALQDGDTDKASVIFREALARYPRDAQLLFGAGVVATRRGQERNAIALLQQALEIDARLTGAAAILGQLLYRQGDLDLAINTYERALAGAAPAAIEGMQERLEAWRQEASLPQNHDAITDDRFTIGFDGPTQQKLAVRATSVLDAAFLRIGNTLGAYPSAPIHIVLYSERQFHDITGAPEWADGGFDGQIRVPVRGAAQNLAEFDRVLTHELTHAMLKSVAPRNLPAWLNEGLAMYCEGHDSARSERLLVRARLFVPLAALQTSFSHLNVVEATIAYEESAFAARALVDRIGSSGLGQLLQDLGAGRTMDEAIERFGVTVAAFESDLQRRVGAGSADALRHGK